MFLLAQTGRSQTLWGQSMSVLGEVGVCPVVYILSQYFTGICMWDRSCSASLVQQCLAFYRTLHWLGWEGPSGGHQAHPCSSSDTQSRVPSTTFRQVLCISGEGSSSPLWAAYASVLSPAQWKKFSGVQREHPIFLFVPFASCPFSILPHTSLHLLVLIAALSLGEPSFQV